MSFNEKLTELRSLLRALGLSLPACLFIEAGMTPENIEPMLAMLMSNGWTRLDPDQLPWCARQGSNLRPSVS